DESGTRLGRLVHRVDAFVPDGHAELVDAVLGAPQPGRARQQGGVRSGVADRQVLRAQRAAGGGAPTEGDGELHLTDGAVRVFGEDHPTGAGATERVAHGSTIRRVTRVSIREATLGPEA